MDDSEIEDGDGVVVTEDEWDEVKGQVHGLVKALALVISVIGEVDPTLEKRIKDRLRERIEHSRDANQRTVWEMLLP